MFKHLIQPLTRKVRFKLPTSQTTTSTTTTIINKKSPHTTTRTTTTAPYSTQTSQHFQSTPVPLTTIPSQQSHPNPNPTLATTKAAKNHGQFYYPSLILGTATAIALAHTNNTTTPTHSSQIDNAVVSSDNQFSLDSHHNNIKNDQNGPQFPTFIDFESFIQSHFQNSPTFATLADFFTLPAIGDIIPIVYANNRQLRARNHIPKPPQSEMRADYHVYGGLSPMEFRPFRCSDISVITEDTCLYCFNLASPSSSLNLPVSSYVLARADIGGETVIRPYTPIANFQGELPVVVKTYPNAKMGSKFAQLEVGDTLYFKGPFQTFVYEPNSFDRVTLVAAGTGVTPMMQLVDKILTNPTDRTKMHLILANNNEYNMPLAAEMNEFAESYPNRLRVTNIVEKPVTNDWDGLVGHISKELLLVSVGKPHPHQKVFVSGPQGFMKAICGQKGEDYTQGQVTGMLGELGFTERDVFKF